jgi:hypothetical protein
VPPKIRVRLLEKHWGPPQGRFESAFGPRSSKEFKSILDAIDQNGFDKKKIDSISPNTGAAYLVLYTLTAELDNYNQGDRVDFQKLLDSKTEKGKYIVISNASEINQKENDRKSTNDRKSYDPIYFQVVPSLKIMKQFSSAIRRAIKKPDNGAVFNYGVPSYDDFVKAFKAAESAVRSGFEISGNSIHRTQGDDVERQTGDLDALMSDNNYKGRYLAKYNAGQWAGRYNAPAGAFVLDRRTSLSDPESAEQNEINDVNRYYKELIQGTKDLLAAIEKKRANQKSQKWSVALVDIDGEEAIEVWEDYASYKEAVNAADSVGVEEGQAVYVVKGTQRYLKPLGVTEEGDDDATVWLVNSFE